LNIHNETLSKIATHKFSRCDLSYWIFQDRATSASVCSLKDLFYFINGTVQTKYYTDEITDKPYIRVGDVTKKYGISYENLIYLNEECEINEEKLLKENDLVITTIGSIIGKVGRVKNLAGGTHSNNTVVLRPKNKDINVGFYEKLLQTDGYAEYLFASSSKKAQPNLQQYDLENIVMPLVDAKIQQQILTHIARIEKKIQTLKSQIAPIQETIDTVFAREFGFDYAEFERVKAIKSYTIGIDDCANNPDLRFSAKFHRAAGGYVMRELNRITEKKIKNYIAEPIFLGASISPKNYDDNGDYYYLSMATIKKWGFDEEDATLTSIDYSDNKAEKTVKKGDIILARSGEGTIGKVALIEDDELKAIFADFTMRIRLENYNPKLAYYYMRTAYFQYLIEIYKKGLGNNTNIFPIVIQELPLPNLSLEDQHRIVGEIQKEIDKQNEIRNNVAELRRKIDEIIENVLN